LSARASLKKAHSSKLERIILAETVTIYRQSLYDISWLILNLNQNTKSSLSFSILQSENQQTLMTLYLGSFFAIFYNERLRKLPIFP
jgi:hypothetical protein